MKDFRLDHYLARIAFDGKVEPDLATLTALHRAHVNTIPFENFDPLLRRPVKLDLISLQDKLVDTRRGGYCFEQNALFKAALETIGFKVTGLSGRVRWTVPAEAPLGPRVHMLLKVECEEGPHIADVGFGLCMLDEPLKFETGLDQRTGMGTYRLSETNGHFALSAQQPAGWRTKYVFNMEPQLPSDYELGNWFTSTSPIPPFQSNLIMERVGRERRYKLINRRFIVEVRDGQPESEHFIQSAQGLHRILEETFRVTPPTQIEEIFALLSA